MQDHQGASLMRLRREMALTTARVGEGQRTNMRAGVYDTRGMILEVSKPEQRAIVAGPSRPL